MASYTTRLNLKKPSGSENVSIQDINGNMDIIDNAYGIVTGQMAGKYLGTNLTKSTFESALNTLLSSMTTDIETAVNNRKNIQFTTASSWNGSYPSGTYTGTVIKLTSTYAVCDLTSQYGLKLHIINYNGTYSYYDFDYRIATAPTGTKVTVGGSSRFEKSGNAVTVTLTVTATSAISAWTELVAIPTGFIPNTSLNYYMPVQIGNTMSLTQVQVLNSTDGGVIRLGKAVANGENVQLTFTYIMDK